MWTCCILSWIGIVSVGALFHKTYAISNKTLELSSGAIVFMITDKWHLFQKASPNLESYLIATGYIIPPTWASHQECMIMAKIRVRWLFCIEIFQVYIAPFLVCCPSEIKFDRRFLPIANGNFSIDVRTGVALQGTKKLVHWTKILLLQSPKK